MNDEWETPIDLFDKLKREFNFEFDLCTNIENSRCSAATDNIQKFVASDEVESFDNFWMNPPYSRGNINICMEEAWKLSSMGKTVVCLVRFDPSASWFQDWVDHKAADVRMLNRRVKFQGADSAYNFPCCLVVYKGNNHMIETDYYLWGWK